MAEVKTVAKPATKRVVIPGTSAKTLQDKARELREMEGADGLRKVQPIDTVDMAPNTVSSKPPQAIWLDPEELWIDGSYQRNLSRESLRLILGIINGWSWEKFKPPVVTRDEEGRYFIIDGQHTAIGAASHPDIDKIPVMFIPIDSIEEAAKAFIAHNTNRVLVTPYSKFRARLTARDTVALGLDEVLKRHGIVVRPWFKQLDDLIEPNQTMATGELEKRFVQLGAARFDELVAHLAQVGFKPLRREHIVAFAELMYGEHRDKISHELLVESVKSLSDVDAWMAAGRLSQGVRGLSRGKGLAIYYLNKYKEKFGGKRRDAIPT